MLDKSLFRVPVVLIGVGNVMKGDDGFGPHLARRLEGRVSFRVIDAGLAPENHLMPAAALNPGTVLFADTGDFGGRPGEFRLLGDDELSDSSFFLTHNSSLELLTEFISAESADTVFFVLCMQPVNMRLGEGLSEEAASGLEKIAGWFEAHFPAG